jgi:hypothetical protein
MWCIVRITLHLRHGDDSWTLYDNLHRLMSEEGFSRQIDSNEGDWYHLPDGEYIFPDSPAVETVIAMARKAATRTEREFSVLVTQSSRCTWWNLKKVEAAEVR